MSRIWFYIFQGPPNIFQLSNSFAIPISIFWKHFSQWGQLLLLNGQLGLFDTGSEHNMPLISCLTQFFLFKDSVANQWCQWSVCHQNPSSLSESFLSAIMPIHWSLRYLSAIMLISHHANQSSCHELSYLSAIYVHYQNPSDLPYLQDFHLLIF